MQPRLGHLPGQGGPSDPKPQWKRDAHRHTYGAIDLGTNNCRLLIARPGDGGFTVIDAFSRIVRLGEGLSHTGKLSDHAMDRAVGALGVCAEKLRRRNVSLSRSVATEACRRAANGMEFVDRVREETGIVLDRLSLPSGSMPQDVRLAPDGTKFYVADMAADGVWILDGERMRQIFVQPAPAPAFPPSCGSPAQ